MTGWMTGGAVVLCCVATWWDLRHRRIPNGLTVPALAAALCLHGALGAWPGFLLSAAGAITAALLVLPGYAMRFTGGGDVKLLAAVGALLSFPDSLLAGLAALMIGGVLGLLSALRLRRLGEILYRSFGLARWIAGRLHGDREPAPPSSGLRVPFGVAIAMGAILIALWPGLGASR